MFVSLLRLLLIISSGMCGCSQIHGQEASRAESVFDDGVIKGIALGLHEPLPGVSREELILEIAATGARWISLVLPYYQKDVESVKMGGRDVRSPSFVEVGEAIRMSREAGLRVMVFPLVLLKDEGDDHWRGDLSPEDRDLWFANYQRLLLGLVELTEKGGGEIFSVGSELTSLQAHGESWTSLIEALRGKFSGALLYSANWDAYEDIPFLQELDLVGVSSYFELADHHDPTVGELMATWRGIRHDLLEWQKGHGVPMIFTELGYASVDGCAAAPWDYTFTTGVDTGEQRDCFEAFVNIWGEEERLAGTFVYEWYGVGGEEDLYYTPKGKPALEVIQRWLRRALPIHVNP